MSKYSQNGFSIGDPIEIETFHIKNLRGDCRVSWEPATVSNVYPLTATFSDSTFIEITETVGHRFPEWALKKFGKHQLKSLQIGDM